MRLRLWKRIIARALTSSDSRESADIFETAMKNNFAVGRILIDAICDQTLSPAPEN